MSSRLLSNSVAQENFQKKPPKEQGLQGYTPTTQLRKHRIFIAVVKQPTDFPSLAVSTFTRCLRKNGKSIGFNTSFCDFPPTFAVNVTLWPLGASSKQYKNGKEEGTHPHLCTRPVTEKKREVSRFIQPWKCKSETEQLGIWYWGGCWVHGRLAAMVRVSWALNTAKAQVNYTGLTGFYGGHGAVDYINPVFLWLGWLRKPVLPPATVRWTEAEGHKSKVKMVWARTNGNGNRRLSPQPSPGPE